MSQRFSRRGFMKLGLGAAAGAAGARLLIGGQGSSLSPVASAQTSLTPRYFLAGTDGWANLPGQQNSSFYPDAWAPAGRTTYMFGFADASAYIPQITTDTPVPAPVLGLKNQAQACAPLMHFDEDQEYVVRLTNLGLQQRPDLTDAHTIHWHGFRNVIPMFDGEPSSSIAVPIGRVFDYDYRPHNAGTYMYHCHFEDTEHVHMGMTGPLFVRPKQNSGNFGQPAGKYAYNDGDGSTRYDREYALILTEVWNESHWADAHIQLPDWTDYKADFFLMNGRVYPDTLLPNYATTSSNGGDLAWQPYSSLIQANSGERVLLRMINLGFTKASLTLSGIRMQVVGQDAVLMRGRNGASTGFATNTVSFGPGESVDAIFVAPTVTSERTYLLYNRNLPGISNNGTAGLGGQLTEVHIRPAGAGSYPAQSNPNDL